MSCLPDLNPLCENKYLVDGLTGWNWNSVAETALGVVLGAVLTFMLGALQWRRQRKADDLRSENRDEREQDSRDRDAVLEVISYMDANRMVNWTTQAFYLHCQDHHADIVSEAFPEPPTLDALIGAKLALAGPLLSSRGQVHGLIRELRSELSKDDYAENPKLLAAAFGAFSMLATEFYEGEISNLSSERFHEAIARFRPSFEDRCGWCKPED